MAAPVIWFGSWLFSLMACSGSHCWQFVLVVFGLGVRAIKNGPREALHTPPVSGMALAIPGGVPGYDDDKQLGNNIAHVARQFPEGCANIAIKRLMSRVWLPPAAFLAV